MIGSLFTWPQFPDSGKFNCFVPLIFNHRVHHLSENTGSHCEELGGRGGLHWGGAGTWSERLNIVMNPCEWKRSYCGHNRKRVTKFPRSRHSSAATQDITGVSHRCTCAWRSEQNKYIKVKGKVVPLLNYLSTTSWRCIGEWMYRSTYSWPRH
jgi:hypothetical protein